MTSLNLITHCVLQLAGLAVCNQCTELLNLLDFVFLTFSQVQCTYKFQPLTKWDDLQQ